VSRPSIHRLALPSLAPMRPAILIKQLRRRLLHGIHPGGPLQHPLVQRVPVDADIWLPKDDARLEAVLGEPLERVDMGVGVAHDGEPEAFEAVVEVLKEVVVDVELGGVVVGVEVLFDAFLKKGKGAKYSAQTAGCQHGGAYQAVETEFDADLTVHKRTVVGTTARDKRDGSTEFDADLTVHKRHTSETSKRDGSTEFDADLTVH